jgi:hypothetical protein
MLRRTDRWRALRDSHSDLEVLLLGFVLVAGVGGGLAAPGDVACVGATDVHGR